VGYNHTGILNASTESAQWMLALPRHLLLLPIVGILNCKSLDKTFPSQTYFRMLLKSFQMCALPMLMLAASGTLGGVGACGTLPPATALDFQASLQAFLDNKCYQTSGWRHDPDIRGTNGVHPNVKVWYSPSMWAWMTGGRHGEAPEGGILVPLAR
jgi:hypothetical protein